MASSTTRRKKMHFGKINHHGMTQSVYSCIVTSTKFGNYCAFILISLQLTLIGMHVEAQTLHYEENCKSSDFQLLIS